MTAYNILSSYHGRSEFDFIEFILILSIFFFIVFVLHWYRQKISTGEKSVLTDFSKRPFYKSRDILLQEKYVEGDTEYAPFKTVTSTFTKIIIMGLILILFLMPFDTMLNILNIYTPFY